MLQKGANLLKKVPLETARLDAEILLAFLLGISRSRLLLSWERVLTPQEVGYFEELLERRARREPVAYITKTKEFMSLEFHVTPAVLIPRPETEHLVEAVIERVPSGYQAWDIGTGSGCIALALAKHSFPNYILATDVETAALEVAKQNAKALGLEGIVHFEKGDLFEAAPPNKLFDAILMNPPYIGWEEQETLAPELAFEPKGALFAEEKGLKYYRRIGEEGHRYLKEEGLLALELSGTLPVEEVKKFFKGSPLSSFTVIKDYSGFDRVLIVQRNMDHV